MKWEPVVEGLWSGQKVMRNGFSLRSMAARLDDGTTLVASPLPGLDDAAHDALLAIGRPSIVLAPNHFHTLGLADFAARYPDARVVCAAGAVPRLKKKTPHAFDDVTTVTPPAWLELISPPGLKGGETWLVATRGDQRIWAVCDAFFNLPRHPSGPFGLITRLGGSAPGLRISGLFKMAGVADKAAWRDWLLAQIEAAPPTLLLPAHGDAWPVDPAALIALIRRRLG